MRKALLIIIVCLLTSSLVYTLLPQSIQVLYFPNEVTFQSPARISWLNPTLPKDEVAIESYCFLGGVDEFDSLFVNDMMYRQIWIENTQEETMEARVYFPQGRNKFYMLGRSASTFFYSDTFSINIQEQPALPSELRIIEVGWASTTVKDTTSGDSVVIKHGYVVWEWDAVEDSKGDSIFYRLFNKGGFASNLISQTQYRQETKWNIIPHNIDNPFLPKFFIQDGDILEAQIACYVERNVAPAGYPEDRILLPSNPSPVLEILVNLPKDTTQSDTTIPPVSCDFELCQNYPNPFNPLTTIPFSLPENNFVSLKIYNILGQKVLSLINDYYVRAGKYEIQVNFYTLPAGVYIYQLQAGEYVQQKKMSLVK